MRFNIVKQSDVSHGTALHYALDWTYGRKALCGKPMRSTARDGEIGYKRVCGSCVKIMEKQVELDHAEAMEIAKDRLDIPEFDEEAVYAQAELSTTIDSAYRVVCAPTVDHPAERAWIVTAPTAAAAQERVCADNNLTWSHIHAGLISTVLIDAVELENELCPPVCEHGNTADQGCAEGTCVTRVDSVHPIALEINEIIAFEQASFDALIERGGNATDAAGDVRWVRDAAAALPCSVDADDQTSRYYALVKKHGVRVPYRVTLEARKVAVDAVGLIHQGVPQVGDFILIGNAGGAHQSPGSYGYRRTEVLAIETRDEDSIYPMARVTTRAFGEGCWTSAHSTRLICGARPAVAGETRRGL